VTGSSRDAFCEYLDFVGVDIEDLLFAMPDPATDAPYSPTTDDYVYADAEIYTKPPPVREEPKPKAETAPYPEPVCKTHSLSISHDTTYV
jgi:hypothetical protein